MSAAGNPLRAIVVSHTHWDREWHRTFQSFRARLVDLIDRVLELCAADPGYRFLLDGQTIVLDDYLAIRPERRAELVAACQAGQLEIGPWYVQPDSLLPAGETHVRNLLEGRRAGAAVGAVSRVAYCPDSFGHPAQFPQLFRGFGLGPFVYWRGNGAERDRLPSEWTWEGADGSTVVAHHLGEGYFAASGLPSDRAAAVTFLRGLAESLAARSAQGVVLLMNGFDHALPEPEVGIVVRDLAIQTGWTVERGLLGDFAAALEPSGGDVHPVQFSGDLLGGRVANLLPGVWSARLPLKIRNRRTETLLTAWTEPWVAIARLVALPDERPALRTAWRALLQNQAHDSIGGCSVDAVHDQMVPRFDEARELALETTARVLERLAGCDVERRSPWSEAFDVAVFNPSPFPRTELVRFRPRPREWVAFRGQDSRGFGLHPWLQIGAASTGYRADGGPARLVPDDRPGRIQLLPEMPAYAIEFVACDVPAFGWRRIRLTPAEAIPDQVDHGRTIAVDDLTVTVEPAGTFTLIDRGNSFSGLGALEDLGDRGDSYDCDPVPSPPPVVSRCTVRRVVDATGTQTLTVDRCWDGPVGLAADRMARSMETVPVHLSMRLRLVPGSGRLDIGFVLDHQQRDHRLRVLFPSGASVERFAAAAVFDVAERSTHPVDAARWVHPAPTTFPHQGFVAANGLTVAAPGLPEAEVRPDGVVAITLVRAVGWLARLDLQSRPQPAGPVIATPGAQCAGRLEARMALFGSPVPAARIAAAEAGLAVVLAGAAPRLAPERSFLAIEPTQVVLSACKPAEDGDGVVVRLLNPTANAVTARVTVDLPVRTRQPVRLDETPTGEPEGIAGGSFEVVLGAHRLESLRLR